MVPFESLSTVFYLHSVETKGVSVAVCEIFSVKEWCTLKTGLDFVHSHWMAPFDRSHTSFNSPSIVTTALSFIVCEIQRLIGRKSQNLYQTCLYRPRPRIW